MPIKQVYAVYDWKGKESTDGFRYCPFCGTPLELKRVDHKNRLVCLNCGFIHFKNPFPAVGLLVAEGDYVLLGKRSGDPGKGKWAIPSGYIEYDEDFLTAAIREVKEETGLDVEIQAILNVESAFLAPRFHFLTIYLLAHVVGGQLVPTSDLEEVAWFPKTGPLPEMAFPQEIDLIESFSTISTLNQLAARGGPDLRTR